MLRLQTYAGISFIGALAAIYHAFNSRGQFYPAMVHLSNSKISLVILMNMGFAIMCILWQLAKCVFLGSLREAEIERLNEQLWRELMEILFAITIFRQDFSVSFIAMILALIFIKTLHWMAQKRVEYIETTPAVTMLSHIRIVSFMGFLLILDSLFLYSSVDYLIKSWKPSVSLFFAFEYMILATTTVSTFVKYVFYVSDMLMEGQWEKKAVYTFYLELIRDLLHLSMYLCFFLVIFMNYGVPLHLIRELYETFRNFKVRVADYIRYRKITSNMNDRFPDATPEELNTGDATCIICREEMVTAKKLVCGHLFHVHCLRSWLERQHTCPTCRALVIPTESGTTASGGQHGVRPEAHQQGTGAASTATQGSSGGGADSSLSQHQARLQAAAAAASIYEKSYVYPSPNTVVWSPGYALHPSINPSNVDLTRDMSASGQTSQQQSGVPGERANFAYPQVPHGAFLPGHTSSANSNLAENSESDPRGNSSQWEVQERFLRRQIEFLQNELQILHQHRPGSMAADDAESDIKGKGVASSSSSSSPEGVHNEEVN